MSDYQNISYDELKRLWLNSFIQSRQAGLTASDVESKFLKIGLSKFQIRQLLADSGFESTEDSSVQQVKSSAKSEGENREAKSSSLLIIVGSLVLLVITLIVFYYWLFKDGNKDVRRNEAYNIQEIVLREDAAELKDISFHEECEKLWSAFKSSGMSLQDAAFVTDEIRPNCHCQDSLVERINDEKQKRKKEQEIYKSSMDSAMAADSAYVARLLQNK